MYTESDGKLNRGLATRVINIAACVCVYAHVCRMHVWEGEVASFIALYVKLNKAVALVRIISVSYVCLPRQYIAHLQIAADGANHKSIPG